ncbi:hypothetical protein B0X30_01755 [Helicobacter pylori]|nr:hypothetical protein B0X30_01755 [Helicobacter pylori]
MFFSFLFFNAVGCLIVNFLDHVNNPYLCFCGVVLGCYLLYEWQKKKDFQSAKSLKFDSVSELEKDLNMEVTNDEWENIKDIYRKNENLLGVENGFFAFFCMIYFMVFVRIVLSINR